MDSKLKISRMGPMNVWRAFGKFQYSNLSRTRFAVLELQIRKIFGHYSSRHSRNPKISELMYYYRYI